MQITNLRTNHFENPVGFQISPLSLSWITEEANGKKTEAARVKIALDSQFARVVWDSEKRTDITGRLKSGMMQVTRQSATVRFLKQRQIKFKEDGLQLLLRRKLMEFIRKYGTFQRKQKR